MTEEIIRKLRVAAVLSTRAAQCTRQPSRLEMWARPPSLAQKPQGLEVSGVNSKKTTRTAGRGHGNLPTRWVAGDRVEFCTPPISLVLRFGSQRADGRLTFGHEQPASTHRLCAHSRPCRLHCCSGRLAVASTGYPTRTKVKSASRGPAKCKPPTGCVDQRDKPGSE